MYKNRVWGWLLTALLVGLVLGVVVSPYLALRVDRLLRTNRGVVAASAGQVLLPTPTPAAFSPNNDLENQVVQLYDSARASVVNITNRGYTTDQFLQPVPQEGTGSGFVYDAKGHIVTNYHVVENARELIVTMADGSNHPAKLVGQDPSSDLAVIQIDATKGITLPALLPMAEPNQQRVGQFVVAIGNPFGLQGTLTVGVISSLGRIIQSPDGRFIGEAIQTDAAINPGNSGGPLLDLKGKVIGINSQILSPSGSSAGIGFAVPVSTVQRVVPQLIARGHYAHPYLGIQSLDIGPNQADFLRSAGMQVPVDQGLLLVDVDSGGPADKAGLRGGNQLVQVGNGQLPIGGDIITAVNDKPVASLQDLTVYVEDNAKVGDTITLTIIRDGKTQQVQTTLAERPQQQG